MGRSLSPAHRAAISAGMKRYWAGKRSGSGSSSGGSGTAHHIETGRAISREEAARIMFGSSGVPPKRKAGGRKVTKGRKR